VIQFFIFHVFYTREKYTRYVVFLLRILRGYVRNQWLFLQFLFWSKRSLVIGFFVYGRSSVSLIFYSIWILIGRFSPVVPLDAHWSNLTIRILIGALLTCCSSVSGCSLVDCAWEEHAHWRGKFRSLEPTPFDHILAQIKETLFKPYQNVMRRTVMNLDFGLGILKQSMGARNRVGIGLSQRWAKWRSSLLPSTRHVGDIVYLKKRVGSCG
jgi:hypothetical protein